jgi:hypothetical protein
MIVELPFEVQLVIGVELLLRFFLYTMDIQRFYRHVDHSDVKLIFTSLLFLLAEGPHCFFPERLQDGI